MSSSDSFFANKKIVVLGGSGFIGSRVAEFLLDRHHVDPLNMSLPGSAEFDLRILESAVAATANADLVIHLAADVGGLPYSTSHPASQFRNCSLIDLQVFEACRINNVGKLVVASSACAYPRDTSYPLVETDLYSGLPQKSNRGYGLAKRMSVAMAGFYREQFDLNVVSLIATNAYGPRDDFDLDTCHVIPAMIQKTLNDQEITVWGDGSATRDFLFVDDFASALILASEKLEGPEPVNIGSGKEVSIKDLVKLIANVNGFEGVISYDESMPAGQPRRVMSIDQARARMGFDPQTSLEEGVQKTVEWFTSAH